MAKIRKPIPKTQKEISRDLHSPTDARYGNPNITAQINENETGIPFNRSGKNYLGKVIQQNLFQLVLRI